MSMDLDRAVAILKEAYLRSNRNPEASKFVGDGLLRCGACTDAVEGHSPRESHYGRLEAMYACRTCGAGGITVAVADAQLQAIAVRYWSRPEPVASWRRQRLTVLDAEIADMLAAGEYSRDRRNRRRLRQAMQGRMRRLTDRLLRLTDLSEPEFSLDFLVNGLIDRIHERASLAAAIDGGPAAGSTARLAELNQIRAEHVAVSDRGFARRYPERAAAYGSPRQREARASEVERQLWALLSERNWADATPEPPPTKTNVLTMDWGTSSNTRVSPRRALLRIIADDWPLVLQPRTAQAEARVTTSTGENLRPKSS